MNAKKPGQDENNLPGKKDLHAKPIGAVVTRKRAALGDVSNVVSQPVLEPSTICHRITLIH
jgi:hypothetical protein